MELEFKDKKLIFSDNAIALMSLLPEGLVEQWQEKAFEVFGRTQVEIAAPDLLEALINLTNTCEKYFSKDFDLREAKKAIEKALK